MLALLEKESDGLRELKATSDPSIRNHLALNLAQTREPEVLEILIELIKRPDLKDSRGTLVHCLGFYDCKPHFNLLVELVTTGNWEVAHEAYTLASAINKISGPQAETAYATLTRYSEKHEIEEWRKDLMMKLLRLFDN